MGKKFLNKGKFNIRRVLPLLMIIFGFTIILFWVPIWIWFVIVGIGLILIGFNIYN